MAPQAHMAGTRRPATADATIGCRTRLAGRAGNCQPTVPHTVLLVGALLLLAAAPCAAIDAPALPVPTQPVTLCMIDGAPELAQASATNPVLDNELLSLTQAKARLRGLSIDLVSAVFDQILGWPVNIRYTTGFSKTLYRTREGDGCNISVSNLFKAASRETCSSACLVPSNAAALGVEEFEDYVCCLDFSHTYFSGGWSLMSHQSNGASIDYIDVFFQRDIVHALAVAVIGMFVVAHLIWMLEARMFGRSNIPSYCQFRPKYLDGLKDGTWFAGTTVLGDVGAGMKLPVTPGGRLLATIWVMFGLFLLSFVTSVISSTLTEAKLRSDDILTIDDVAGKRVCMQKGFYEFVFGKSFPGVGIQTTTYELKSRCIADLRDGKVDAVFGVREEFVNYFSQGLGAGLLVSPVIKSQEYSIAFPDRWPYAPDVNAAILTYRESIMATQPSYKDMVDRWYSGDANKVTYGGDATALAVPWNWGLIGTAIAFVALYLLLQLFVMIAAYLTQKPTNEPSTNPSLLNSQKNFGSTNSSVTKSTNSGTWLSGAKSTKTFVTRVANKISSVHPEEHGAEPVSPMPPAVGMDTLAHITMQLRRAAASARAANAAAGADGSKNGGAELALAMALAAPPPAESNEMMAMIRLLVADISQLKASVSAIPVPPQQPGREEAAHTPGRAGPHTPVALRILEARPSDRERDGRPSAWVRDDSTAPGHPGYGGAGQPTRMSGVGVGSDTGSLKKAQSSRTPTEALKAPASLAPAR